MAVDTLTAEYEALTTGVGLVDRSERGKLLLTGSEVKEFLQGQVSNDVVGLEPGTGCYAAFLTPKGKMLGDLRILDGGDAGLWLDTERATLQELFNLIRRFKLGRDVEIAKRTAQRGMLSLIGPLAHRVDGIEHSHELANVGGRSVRLVATDLGTDVICDAEGRDRVHEALVAEGAVACGEAAAEVMRVQTGRPRYGIDLSDSVIPQEAGLNERAVSFTKGCYVGQETVARLFYRGKPNRRLLGLALSAPLAAGTPLELAGKTVATVLSSVVSPAHGPIALALVRREAGPGDELTAADGATARVAELPFS